MAFSKHKPLKAYPVVEFPEENNSCAVVSSKWLSCDRALCTWPSAIGTKLENLVKSSAEPSSYPRLTWTSLPCRVLGSYGKKYSKI